MTFAPVKHKFDPITGEFTDRLGKEVKVGDVICNAALNYKSAVLRIYKVEEFIPTSHRAVQWGGFDTATGRRERLPDIDIPGVKFRVRKWEDQDWSDRRQQIDPSGAIKIGTTL